MRHVGSLRGILGKTEAERWLAEAVKARQMQDEPNRLIRELVNPKRVPTEREIKRILDHVAKAPFSARNVPVDPAIRGKDFHGRRLEKSEPSIVAHFAKRVLDDAQWADDVTTDEYLDHLRSAVQDAESRKVVFVGKDRRLFLGVLASNGLPGDRLGPGAKPFIFVLYAADYGTIVSGYQVSRTDQITLPEGARWL